MTRHMFISAHNHWFSRLALLSSLIVLSGILLGSYTQLIAAELFQTYFVHSISILILFLTAAAIYLHRELGYKPFVICLGLLLLAISQHFTNQWSSAFAQTLIKLCMLSLFWWVSAITGPRDAVLIREKDKKYRLWAWLGLLLLCSQMLLGAWITSHNGLITLHILYRIGTIVTTAYLSIFSIVFIYNRALGEIGMLILLFMLTQIILGILGLVLQQPFWISFGHTIVSVFVLLAIISLLIALYRKYLNAYS